MTSFFFAEPRHEFETRLPPGSLAASRRGFAFCVADPIGSAHEWTRIDMPSVAAATYGAPGSNRFAIES
jgi:hypothetical protein